MDVSQTPFTMASSLLESAGAANRARSPAALRGVGLMVGGNMLLGTVGLFVDKAARPPLEEVFVRCAIGCAALVAFAAASGFLRKPSTRLPASFTCRSSS